MMRNCVRAALTVLVMTGVSARAADVSVTLRPDHVLNHIDEKIYGHFLEHIYHSCNGGLWGELIWNRSFEQNQLGQWHVEDDQIVQGSMATDQRLTFGDPRCRDYEFSLEAKKVSGDEGFLILFRVKSKNEFYWANLGGWGNTHHRIERGLNDGNRWGGIGPQVDGRIDTGRWYRIRVRCEGRRFHVFLDDKQLIDFTDDAHAHLQGMVGVGTWSTRARFRNVCVKSLDGKTLLEGVPDTVARPSVGLHWTQYGDGRAYIEQTGALNANYYQRIVSTGGETGVQQGPINVHADEVYAGSIWARRGTSGAPVRMAVRLVDGKKTWHLFCLFCSLNHANPTRPLSSESEGLIALCMIGFGAAFTSRRRRGSATALFAPSTRVSARSIHWDEPGIRGL